MGVIKTQSYVLPSGSVKGQTRNIGYLADGTAIAALLCDYTGSMASANVRLFHSTNDGDTWKISPQQMRHFFQWQLIPVTTFTVSTQKTIPSFSCTTGS